MHETYVTRLSPKSMRKIRKADIVFEYRPQGWYVLKNKYNHYDVPMFRGRVGTTVSDTEKDQIIAALRSSFPTSVVMVIL